MFINRAFSRIFPKAKGKDSLSFIFISYDFPEKRTTLITTIFKSYIFILNEIIYEKTLIVILLCFCHSVLAYPYRIYIVPKGH